MIKNKLTSKKIIIAGIVITVLPFIFIFLVYPFYKLSNCEINNYFEVCKLFGLNLGNLFDILDILPFFQFITFPMGLLIVFVGLLVRVAERSNPNKED